MSQKRRFLWICFFVCVVCSPAPSADRQFSKFILGFNVGMGEWLNTINKDIILIPITAFPVGAQAFISDTDTDVNYQYGFNLQYNFTPNFGLQAELSRFHADYTVVIAISRTGDPVVGYDPVEVPWKVTTLYLNGLFSFRKTPGRIVPYAFAGVGFNILSKKSAAGKYFKVESEPSVDVGLKGGGGIGYDLPQAPLGFELRAFILYLTTTGLEGYSYYSYTSPLPEFSTQNFVWGLDLGIKYRF